MKYRIQVNLFLTTEKDYNDLWTLLQNFFNRDTIVNIKEGQINVEKSTISRHICYNDEQKQCPQPEVISK